MQLDDVVAVGQDFLLCHGFDLQRLFRLRQLVGNERVRQCEHRLVVRLVDLVRDDGRPLRHERPEPAGVIEMLVRIHHVPDRLVRNQPFRLGDDRAGPLFALRAFNHHDVVLEINRQARIPAENQVDAVGKPFRRRSRRLPTRRSSRHRRAAPALRSLDGDRRIRLHIAHVQIEDRVAALLLHDLHRKFHAAEIPVIGVCRLEQHVSKHGVVDPCLDALDHLLAVDVSVHLRLVLSREGEDVVVSAVNGLRLERGTPGRGCPEKALRHHPDFQLLDPGRIRVDDDRLILRLFAPHRLQASAVGRVLALYTNAVHSRSRHPEVDRPRVADVDEFRPRRGRAIRLPQRKIEPGRGILDGVQVVGAHRFRRRADDGPGVLRCGERRDHRQEYHGNETLLQHIGPPVISSRTPRRWCPWTRRCS